MVIYSNDCTPHSSVPIWNTPSRFGHHTHKSKSINWNEYKWGRPKWSTGWDRWTTKPGWRNLAFQLCCTDEIAEIWLRYINTSTYMTLRRSPINISKCKIVRVGHMIKSWYGRDQKTEQEDCNPTPIYFRTLQNWNDLPRSAVHAKTINKFKNELDDAWMEKPFKFNHEITTQSGS